MALKLTEEDIELFEIQRDKRMWRENTAKYTLWLKDQFEDRNIYFDFETLKKALGRGYEFLTSVEEIERKILTSAKGTKKSFNLCIYIIWLMCNSREWNVLAMRNTIATIGTTLIPTFLKAIRLLINQHGVSELLWVLEHGNHTRSQFERKLAWPYGTKILFGAFETADKYAGVSPEVGSFMTFFIDEPIAKNPSEKIDYRKQKEDYLMIVQSTFRGITIDKGFKKIPLKLEEDNKTIIHTEHFFQREILLSMNPWDKNHWIMQELVEEAIPDKEWREFVLDDVENNVKKEVVLTEEIVDEVSGDKFVSKTLVVKMQKGINEFVEHDEKIRDMVLLREGTSYAFTATYGFLYDGDDPSIFVYRASMRQTIGFENNKNDEYEFYTWGLDFGKRDTTALSLLGWYSINGKIIGSLIEYREFTNGSLEKGKDERIRKGTTLTPLEIARVIKDWVFEIIVERYDILEKINKFTYDEKGEMASNLIEEQLKQMEIYKFIFNISVKRGWPIVVRQNQIKYAIESGLLLINFDDNNALYEEMWDIIYGQDGIQREEKNQKIDGINSLEYAVEPARWGIMVAN